MVIGVKKDGNWKQQGKKYQGNIHGQRSASGTFDVTSKNVARMLKGYAPKGIDGKSVNLHHRFG